MSLCFGLVRPYVFKTLASPLGSYLFTKNLYQHFIEHLKLLKYVNVIYVLDIKKFPVLSKFLPL